MDSFFTRFRNPLALIALVLVQTLALAIQVQRPGQGFVTGAGADADGRKVTVVRSWMVGAVTPIERALHGSSLAVRSLWWNYLDLRGARQQSRVLTDEVVRLRREQAEFAEDAAQGRRLQTLLAFRQQYISKTVAAQVIGTSGIEQSHVLYLDKGFADGLRQDQAVITPDGIVGKLRDVFPHSAQLLLISDPSWGVGVMLASTRIRGILRGTAQGGVQIDNLTADSRIQPGEKVLTSGGDQVFPRGLPVGVVDSIAPDPGHQPYTAIQVKPWSNLDRLEEVLVITATAPDLPAAAQGDAAVAEGTAQQGRKAADVLAERLPGIHEKASGAPAANPSGSAARPAPGATVAPPQGNDTVGGVPGIPNSGLPKPRTPLHSDRYTPGSTPPAGDLQPGAARPRGPHSTPEPGKGSGSAEGSGTAGEPQP